jgi:FlaA1/EpsC-like NDP-sugar epimerase
MKLHLDEQINTEVYEEKIILVTGGAGSIGSGLVRRLLDFDPMALQQVLGHSSLNVTAVYLQFNDQDIKELYDQTVF